MDPVLIGLIGLALWTIAFAIAFGALLGGARALGKSEDAVERTLYPTRGRDVCGAPQRPPIGQERP